MAGVWSSKKVEQLIEEYNQTGVMPKNNPFYMGDQELRKPDLAFEYTEEEYLELGKTSKSIIYFGEKFAKVMTDAGITTVRLREYQKKVLLQFERFRFNVYLASRQCGKSVASYSEVQLESGEYKMLYELYLENKEKTNFIDKSKLFLYKLINKLEVDGRFF